MDTSQEAPCLKLKVTDQEVRTGEKDKQVGTNPVPVKNGDRGLKGH